LSAYDRARSRETQHSPVKAIDFPSTRVCLPRTGYEIWMA